MKVSWEEGTGRPSNSMDLRLRSDGSRPGVAFLWALVAVCVRRSGRAVGDAPALRRSWCGLWCGSGCGGKFTVVAKGRRLHGVFTPASGARCGVFNMAAVRAGPAMAQLCCHLCLKLPLR